MRDLTTKNDGITRSKERITKNGEVFTPKSLVEKMMDKIPEEKWKDPNSVWLEPTFGSGNSSKDRLEKIALDIIFDFETKQRLCDGRGNALLVAGSIAEACRYYEIFQEKNFKNCAIVSSYKPNRGELRTDFSSTTEDSSK